MTDAEIIKALESCINEDGDLFSCGHNGCVFMHYKTEACRECSYYMHKAVLDLISRQKAEIERCVNTLCKKEDMTQLIAKERQMYYDEWQMAKAEIKRLKKEINISQHLLSDAWRNIEIKDKFCETARAEAIKEFAERLIELYTDEHITDDMHCSIGVIKQNIYDVKEIMVGE